MAPSSATQEELEEEDAASSPSPLPPMDLLVGVAHDNGACTDDTQVEEGNVAAHTHQQRAQHHQIQDQEQARILQEEWDLCLRDPYKACPQSKYKRYQLKVDHESGDRAIEIKLTSVARPHMRSLHCAWISFFLAFSIWFAPAPLLKEIQESLNLSKKEVWTSSITSDCTAIFLRVVMGPICDSFGARIPMAAVLVLGSIPTALIGLVDSAWSLAVVRLCIGVAGSSFVMAQFWPSRMFARDIAGTAMGVVGGWGNLGGAWTQLFMGRLLFPLFRDKRYDGDAERAWRTICVIPASIAFLFGIILPFISDDAPAGNYGDMKKRGTMDRIYMTTSLRSGATRNTWILYAQYACSFGVELVMNNAAVLYFTSEFDLTTEEASMLGFLYGSMNLFARGLGGYVSDRIYTGAGMRGRLWLITILLILEGAAILAFAWTKTLAGAVQMMCIFSIFTQAAEGAIYGVVPYVSKLYTGSVAGLVGAGGNAGSVLYGLGFRSLPYRTAFLVMGSIVIASSSLSVLVKIPCHAQMLWGKDNATVIQARERFVARRRALQEEQEMRERSMHSCRVNVGDRSEEDMDPLPEQSWHARRGIAAILPVIKDEDVPEPEGDLPQHDDDAVEC